MRFPVFLSKPLVMVERIEEPQSDAHLAPLMHLEVIPGIIFPLNSTDLSTP